MSRRHSGQPFTWNPEGHYTEFWESDEKRANSKSTKNATQKECQEALYLKQLLEDFGNQQKHPIAIGEDNQSCIRLCQNPVMHKRSKHIETKFQFIWDKMEGGPISFHYVPTEKMAANIFTKSLPVSKAETFRTLFTGTGSAQSGQV